jgi:hypothetical protein
MGKIYEKPEMLLELLRLHNAMICQIIIINYTNTIKISRNTNTTRPKDLENSGLCIHRRFTPFTPSHKHSCRVLTTVLLTFKLCVFAKLASFSLSLPLNPNFRYCFIFFMPYSELDITNAICSRV